MQILTISLIIIAVNLAITTLMIKFFVDLITEKFNLQDKFDDIILKDIWDIYEKISNRSNANENTKSNK